jgi:hypothetical protein
MPTVQIPDPINPSLLKTVDAPGGGPVVFPLDPAPATPNDHRQPAKGNPNG